MTFSPSLRKLVLFIHLTSALGWVGAVVAYLALGITASTRQDSETIRAVWIAMELIGWWVLVPLALASLASGLVISLGTSWGLFRHYWVLISLGLTVLATVILVAHMPSVSWSAAIARGGDPARLSELGGDLGHAVGGLVVLLTVTLLNVFKPRGLTPYGWRKQQQLQSRRGARPIAGHPLPAFDSASVSSRELAADRSEAVPLTRSRASADDLPE
jgi:hypothetical protein